MASVPRRPFRPVARFFSSAREIFTEAQEAVRAENALAEAMSNFPTPQEPNQAIRDLARELGYPQQRGDDISDALTYAQAHVRQAQRTFISEVDREIISEVFNGASPEPIDHRKPVQIMTSDECHRELAILGDLFSTQVMSTIEREHRGRVLRERIEFLIIEQRLRQQIEGMLPLSNTQDTRVRIQSLVEETMQTIRARRLDRVGQLDAEDYLRTIPLRLEQNPNYDLQEFIGMDFGSQEARMIASLGNLGSPPNRFMGHHVTTYGRSRERLDRIIPVGEVAYDLELQRMFAGDGHTRGGVELAESSRNPNMPTTYEQLRRAFQQQVSRPSPLQVAESIMDLANEGDGEDIYPDLELKENGVTLKDTSCAEIWDKKDRIPQVAINIDLDFFIDEQTWSSPEATAAACGKLAEKFLLEIARKQGRVEPKEVEIQVPELGVRKIDRGEDV